MWLLKEKKRKGFSFAWTVKLHGLNNGFFCPISNKDKLFQQTGLSNNSINQFLTIAMILSAFKFWVKLILECLVVLKVI